MLVEILAVAVKCESFFSIDQCDTSVRTNCFSLSTKDWIILFSSGQLLTFCYSVNVDQIKTLLTLTPFKTT
uniref:Uncharacterized protein n=1 Tax=Arundo donax TaxID=35708 RepID=A0A0A9HLC7_ARUDO